MYLSLAYHDVVGDGEAVDPVVPDHAPSGQHSVDAADAVNNKQFIIYPFKFNLKCDHLGSNIFTTSFFCYILV